MDIDQRTITLLNGLGSPMVVRRILQREFGVSESQAFYRIRKARSNKRIRKTTPAGLKSKRARRATAPQLNPTVMPPCGKSKGKNIERSRQSNE